MCSTSFSIATKKEQGLYVPFVKIANLVRDLCCNLKVNNLVPAQAGNKELLFHVNNHHMAGDDYCSIDGTPFIESTQWKPDIVATHFAAVCLDAPSAVSWAAYCNAHATQKPAHPLSWFNAQVAIKVKPYCLKGKDKQKAIPKQYSSKAKPESKGPQPIQVLEQEHMPLNTPLGQPGLHVPDHIAAYSSACSPSTAATGLNVSTGKCKASKLKSDVPSQRQKVSALTASAHNLGFATKARADDSKDCMMDGAVQLAIYAGACMLSSPIITHSINILLRGQDTLISCTNPADLCSGHIMYLWYFDRGCIICLEGMDFINNFLFLVVFLSIFHYMDCHRFGQHWAFQLLQKDELPEAPVLASEKILCS